MMIINLKGVIIIIIEINLVFACSRIFGLINPGVASDNRFKGGFAKKQ
jgi:hypothetical protein